MPFFNLTPFSTLKNSTSRRAAFTLLEMLVVIAIIGFLAAALMAGLRSAQRQAHTTQCQARLKNLHQACMNHLADTGTYPFAGSHEFRDPVSKNYREHKGWVAWVRKDGAQSGKKNNPWSEDNTKTHADQFQHASWTGAEVERSIREGAIFEYTGRDPTTYRCPTFATRHNINTKTIIRSYQMNQWFGSRRNEPNRGREPHDFQIANKEPSRMGYLAELGPLGELDLEANTKVYTGEEYKKGKRSAIHGDSVWEYGDDERYGLYHPKAGALHGHVIFVDGHIESLTAVDHESQNSKLGKATF